MCRGFGPVGERGDGRAADRTWRRANSARGRCVGRWDYLASCAPDSLQGQGVLQAAVRGDRPDVLRRLLETGLDPNERMLVVNRAAAEFQQRRDIPDKPGRFLASVQDEEGRHGNNLPRPRR